jgi:hypothetical protein
MQSEASDSRPRRKSLEDALSVCRDELQAQLGNGSSMESLRGAVRDYAALAYQEAMPPERTLAAFKDMIQSMPAVARRPADERGEIMRQLVQMAIHGYYGESDTRST